MEPREPLTELHAGFSSQGAHPTEWAEGRQHLEEAEVFWLSTVRPDGRPHVTPLLAVWCADAMYFCTGSEESGLMRHSSGLLRESGISFPAVSESRVSRLSAE